MGYVCKAARSLYGNDPRATLKKKSLSNETAKRKNRELDFPTESGVAKEKKKKGGITWEERAQ